MYIKAVHIKNFRNFTTFDTDFEPLTLITGANNSGKSNLFAALEKILSLTSPRNARISQSDFNNATLPIVIEITFHHLTEHDKAAFHHSSGLINAKNQTLKLHFEAKWDADEQDVISECYFVRDELPENPRIADYTRNYREHVAHYFTSSFQSSERELSFSQRQSFGKIIRGFAGDYLKPIDVLNSHLFEAVKKLKDEIELTSDETLSETERDEILGQCDEIIKFCVAKDILQTENETEFDAIIDELKNLATAFSTLVDKLKADHTNDDLRYLSRDFNTLITQMQVLEQRLSIRKDLVRWSKELQEANSFKVANEQLVEVFNQLFLDRKLIFQMLPIGDEQLIGTVAAMLDEFPLGDHGNGYKSIFNIGLGLTEVLATEMLNDRRSAITCLFIEEIEHNLNPYMQRHLINQLRAVQNNWSENGRHLQIILTTHSPSCLKRVSPTELVQLRSNSRVVKWTGNKLEELASTLTPSKSLSQIRRWSDRLFGEFAEVLFSKIVIIVEGYTEQGFISAMVEEVTNADYLEISLINAGSGNEIQYVATLLKGLEIPFICIADGGDGHDLSMIPEEYLFSTKEKALEKEIISFGCYDEILKIIDSYLPEGSIENKLAQDREFKRKFPNADSLDTLIEEISEIDDDQERVLGSRVLSWMKSCKGIEFGFLLYTGLSPSNIPQTYKDAVSKAEEIAKGEDHGSR